MFIQGCVCLLLGFHPMAVDEVDDIRASVLGVGDLDGDGTPDLVVASRDGCAANPELPSTIWVLSGCDGGEVFRVRAPEGDSEFGRALAAAGDLDGDGFVDLLVAGHGRVHALTSIDGGWLFAISSPDPGYDTFGHAIAGGHDLDADGFPDFAVSAASLSYHEPPPVYLFAGPAGAVLGRLEPDAPESGRGDWRRPYGQGVSLLQDMDGDGGGEIAISVRRGFKGCKDAQGEPPPGHVDVRKADGGLLQRILEPSGGASSGLWNGWNLCQAGDLDGDGEIDLAVAAPSYDVSVHSLADGSTLLARDYSWGYMLSEGTSLGAVGDLNGDGRDDLLVAGNETGLDCDGGDAFILSGADASVLYAYDPGRISDEGCGLGVDAAPIGDVDGDALTDIVVHVPRAGRIELLSGNRLRPILQRSISTLSR